MRTLQNLAIHLKLDKVSFPRIIRLLLPVLQHLLSVDMFKIGIIERMGIHLLDDGLVENGLHLRVFDFGHEFVIVVLLVSEPENDGL